MKKLKISGFDLGCIIAFVVLTLIGAGGWYYFTGAVADSQMQVNTSNAAFLKYSADPKSKFIVAGSNIKTLQANIDLLKDQTDPVIRARFMAKENKLHAIDKEDSIAWKHDLDDEVHRLNNEAKTHNVVVPTNFYFGFSRYVKDSPADEATAVLSKQLVAIDQIATILIYAPVKSIQTIKRTSEEDANPAKEAGPTELDRVGGKALTPAGTAYTEYPFEIEFQTTSENLRTVIAGLMKSPYVFVIRSMAIQNTNLSSPQLSSLDTLAGGTPGTPSVINTDPGDVAATPPPTKGPQYLFGNSALKVRMRVDMIEWNAGLMGAK